jgi:hypothetical protein
MQMGDTVATFTARTWLGQYMLPLGVSLRSKSSTKSSTAAIYQKRVRRCAGWRTPRGLRARRSLCPLNNRKPSLWRTRNERRAKNGRLHYLWTKSSTYRKLDEVPSLGRFASFHWNCFGEYLRADSEHQVEKVVWKASSNAHAEQGDR